ncbi:alkaline phosphatase family protein [Bradyrhizobium diazoefficiens]|uniref:alkaline phosphatase family protein n=1 Tax=Bradyrhizobium diazoefficiens TaxID=1355477 RepID=UPI00190CFD78|nr:alkaline phosphatase family protein [Bradyrhizobium diazoefficiens]QQO36671.1 alkaline phosphatase family protein [Bradyrhizobium diazoefficiens]
MTIEKRPFAGVAIAFVSALGLSLLAPSFAHAEDKDKGDVKHVLLISVDGMHEVDLQRYVGAHPSSSFGRLLAHGVHFADAHTARPSDSFPGLLAFMTGGTPKTHGVFYDDSYDRKLFAPGSNCQGQPGTEALYAENLAYDITKLDGGGPAGSDHIDPAHLPMRLKGGKCEVVYPHQYLKLNTIMEVIHEAGRRTAWSDKHPAYEIISGPSGKGLDELYAPEINSTTVPGQPGADWTTDPSFTRTYDQLKVTAVLNWIKGFDHTGKTKVGVPAIFGMNFQAVSVGQKVTADGYLDAAATPSPQLQASLDFVDASLGQMLDALADQHIARDTLVIVGAKHGQSPIDVNKLHMLTGSTNPKLGGGVRADVTDPADLLTNGGVQLAQETADDVALIWLQNQGDAEKAVAILEADRKASNRARIEKIYAGEQLVDRFGDPAAGRTPDIIIQPIAGTIYSKSKKKIAEHGGFAEDDTHVLLVVSNPKLAPTIVHERVANRQVAPTILKALGLEPDELEAVRGEDHTHLLPGVRVKDRD